MSWLRDTLEFLVQLGTEKDSKTIQPQVFTCGKREVMHDPETGEHSMFDTAKPMSVRAVSLAGFMSAVNKDVREVVSRIYVGRDAVTADLALDAYEGPIELMRLLKPEFTRGAGAVGLEFRKSAAWEFLERIETESRKFSVSEMVTALRTDLRDAAPSTLLPVFNALRVNVEAFGQASKSHDSDSLGTEMRRNAVGADKIPPEIMISCRLFTNCGDSIPICDIPVVVDVDLDVKSPGYRLRAAAPDMETARQRTAEIVASVIEGAITDEKIKIVVDAMLIQG